MTFATTLSNHDCTAAAASWPSPHRLWSIDIDPLTMGQAVARLKEWIQQEQAACHVVVTPNVDHLVQLHRRPELRPVYRAASLTLADGWPLVTMSKWFGKRLPQRVAGSDLLPALCGDFDSRSEPIRPFLLGGNPGVPERAARRIHANWRSAEVVGTLSPPPGFEHDAEQNERICDAINASGADLLIVGLGFPKQEIWLSKHRQRLNVPVAMAVGATIDFLAGEQTRAPRWVQKINMEWFYRMATDPRRLTKRYLTDAVWFPRICVEQMIRAAATEADCE